MPKDLPDPLLANIEMEQALLGAILADNSHMHGIRALRAEHFFEPVHQRIFEAITTRTANGGVASPTLLRHNFDNDEALRDIGGGRYLGKLAAAAFHVFDPLDFEREIISLWRGRQLREVWQRGIGALEQGRIEEAAAEVNAATHKVLFEATASFFRTDFDIATEILDDLKAERTAYSTGLPALDVTMGGGLYPGMAYGFAARKKCGKTILASTIACNLNLAGVRHLFICGEMSAKEVHQRTLARLADEFPSGFRTRHTDERFGNRIADAAMKSHRCTLYLDAPGITFEHLRRACAAAVATKGIKGIILDYWQLVGGKEARQSTSEHLDLVAQWIADFCRKHQLWAVVMAQINQEGNTRGGEGIRLAFDQVYQIHRPEDRTLPHVWLEMLDTRYTAWSDVGSETLPAFLINGKGPYFEQV
jgi:replicative DNA helicase